MPFGPAPKQRALRGGAHKGMFTPAKTRQTERKIKRFLASSCLEVFSGPVVLFMVFVFHAYKTPKWKNEAQINLKNHKKGKPDVDNLVKLLKDSMNEVVLKDDAQAIAEFSWKIYGPEDGIFLYLEEVEEQNSKEDSTDPIDESFFIPFLQRAFSVFNELRPK